MDVLFIHQNFPGQFRHIARHLADLSNFRVLAIGQDHAPGLNGVRLHRYRPHRKASSKVDPYARTFEEAVLNGQQIQRLLLKLKQGADVGFDPEFPATMDDFARISSRNGLHLLNLENCDAATPAHREHTLHPVAYQNKSKVIHKGIDVTRLGPDSEATLLLPNGKVLKADELIITYVACNLEPYRGFHQFMRALPRLLAAHATCQVVIIGYGIRLKDAAAGIKIFE